MYNIAALRQVYRHSRCHLSNYFHFYHSYNFYRSIDFLQSKKTSLLLETFKFFLPKQSTSLKPTLSTTTAAALKSSLRSEPPPPPPPPLAPKSNFGDMNDDSFSSASTVTRLTIQSPPPPSPSNKTNINNHNHNLTSTTKNLNINDSNNIITNSNINNININNNDIEPNQRHQQQTNKSLFNYDNLISQVERNPSKPRNRSFFSQLLCCFKPSTSTVYYKVSNKNGRNAGGDRNINPPMYFKPLLPSRDKGDDKICMVIDLDETLVHSSFKPIDNADFVVTIEIDGSPHQVYVLKRPHVDEFLKRMGQLYECVLFTASLAKYADPVADLLDKEKMLRARLFRESCSFYRGNYVKDLDRLGRDLNRVIIVDNSPASYMFHPQNAVPVQSWFDDPNDSELLNLIPFLEDLSSKSNVYPTLKESRYKQSFEFLKK